MTNKEMAESRGQLIILGWLFFVLMFCGVSLYKLATYCSELIEMMRNVQPMSGM